MLDLYRGSVNTWECDEMGHMNVRFYVAKMMEGLAVFSHHIGLPHAFQPKGPSTLIPYDQHIRFMKEIHPGRPVTMVGGVLDVTETGVRIYQELKHTVTGETAAAFRTWVRHAESKSGIAFAWAPHTRKMLESLRIEDPTHSAPRSIDPMAEPLLRKDAHAGVADELGIPVVGIGAVPVEHCDPHGRMKPEHFIGRVSDAVPNLMAEWRDEVARTAADAGEDVRTGAAVLEYRLIYRKAPKAGDLIEVRTGLGMVKPKVYSLVHWLTDPSTGQVYCTSSAVVVTFDLNSRKVIAANPDHMAMLEKRAVRGLRL